MDTSFEYAPGKILYKIHPRARCEGQYCVIHNPSNHSMRSLPLHWRDDLHIFERICEHGVGHPDPDCISFMLRFKGKLHGGAVAVHGCDGCCNPKRNHITSEEK